MPEDKIVRTHRLEKKNKISLSNKEDWRKKRVRLTRDREIWYTDKSMKGILAGAGV